jgi:hypothetical protein
VSTASSLTISQGRFSTDGLLLWVGAGGDAASEVGGTVGVSDVLDVSALDW